MKLIIPAVMLCLACTCLAGPNEDAGAALAVALAKHKKKAACDCGCGINGCQCNGDCFQWKHCNDLRQCALYHDGKHVGNFWYPTSTYYSCDGSEWKEAKLPTSAPWWPEKQEAAPIMTQTLPLGGFFRRGSCAGGRCGG